MDIGRRDLLLTGTVVAAAAAAAAPARAQTQTQEIPAANARSNIQAGDDQVAYEGGKDVKRLRIINTAELEVEAEKILPKGGFDYIQSGSGAEYTKRANLRAMESTFLEPHFLSGVLKPDLSVSILGSNLPFPIIVAPMGSHGRAHVSKEVDQVWPKRQTRQRAHEPQRKISRARRGHAKQKRPRYCPIKPIGHQLCFEYRRTISAMGRPMQNMMMSICIARNESGGGTRAGVIADRGRTTKFMNR